MSNEAIQFYARLQRSTPYFLSIFFFLSFGIDYKQIILTLNIDASRVGPKNFTKYNIFFSLCYHVFMY